MVIQYIGKILPEYLKLFTFALSSRKSNQPHKYYQHDLIK